ncbi:uncharacterized protein LOC119731407 [Patiria miniata]|uniref:Uncharacterized protein n=1 Tax=Patiria miniata TaxID=46514 RepID=A0A914AAP1_PATMI|nr:uncharacterized protein LOC119731407 [Patiria miniata]
MGHYHHKEKLPSLIDSTLASLDAGDTNAAKEALKQASTEIKQRQKLIKLADHSSQGWATVKEYVTDNIADDSNDEKRLRTAEKMVTSKKAEAAKKSKTKTRNAVRPYPAASSFRPYSGYTYHQDFRSCSCPYFKVHGTWSPVEQQKSSTWRELAAVFKRILSDKRWAYRGSYTGTLVVPHWPTSSFWPIICPDGIHFHNIWNRISQGIDDPEMQLLARHPIPSLLLSAKAPSTTKVYSSAW